MSLNMLVKSFLLNFFFTDHLKRKTVNKKLVEHLQRILTNYMHIS